MGTRLGPLSQSMASVAFLSLQHCKTSLWKHPSLSAINRLFYLEQVNAIEELQHSHFIIVSKYVTTYHKGGLEPSLTDGDLEAKLPSLANLDTLVGVAKAGVEPR